MRSVQRMCVGGLVVLGLAACTTTAASTPIGPPGPTIASTSSGSPTPSVVANGSTALSAQPDRPSPSHVAVITTKPPPSATSSRPVGTGLPLAFSTGSATQLITVVAAGTSSTTGLLQAWTKVGTTWQRHGPAILAHLGSAGLTTHPSESLSATPIGSFTLTEAFGHDVNPGTSLPYRHTTPADWWISQPGPLYNTLQHCASACAFDQAGPNEHLYYEMPYYTYAVVIDYNRGPVVQGAGSAFFLHVSVGQPTQGCVSIPEANLVDILRWLTPSAHPRILIGIAH